MTIKVPSNYKSYLDIWQTEHAIKLVKDTFQIELASALRLRRITAPIIVKAGKGLNDNLSGSEEPVSFPGANVDTDRIEIVQSLAKWKRFSLWRHHIAPGYGIYTDMNAIRPNETVDPIHSLYVDQWDWEKVITPQERNLETLYDCVKDIYAALKGTEFILCERYPELKPFLPNKIHFIHSQELLDLYPDLSPKERETEITRKYGAVFIRGIGGLLSNGEKHDGRSPDYDDWSTVAEDGLMGLNGDILVWNPTLEIAFEISSMGIRVSPESLKEQLKLENAEYKSSLLFHSLLLDGKLPQTMGGGIGQSRICMLLLQKAHIGEIQSSIWDDATVEYCEKNNIFLL